MTDQPPADQPPADLPLWESPPLFEPRDGLYMPDWIARSPWRPGALNGLAIGGLLAHTMLEAEPREDMDIARFTLDILRPAPMAPIAASWRRLREGRRTNVLEGVLSAEGAEVARATALFVRRGEGAPASVFAPPQPAPDDAPSDWMLPPRMGVESRLIHRVGVGAGADERLGRVWVRQYAPIVTGGPVHPVICAIQAGDFAGSLCSGVDRTKWLGPNVDIGIHFIRPPNDAWVLVESQALVLGNGTVVTDGQLSDLSGVFARAHVTLVLSPAEGAPKVAWG